MKTNRYTDIGFAALPIFCCLLGAVVVMTMAAKATLGITREQVQRAEQQCQQLQQTLDLAQRAHEEARQRTELAHRRRALQALERAVTERRQQCDALAQTVEQSMKLQAELKQVAEERTAAERELARARERVGRLEREAQVARSQSGPLGSYRGAYILVECHADGATVHPGARKIAAKSEPAELAWLFQEIDRAGFVAIAARPAAFSASYDKLRNQIYEHVEAANQGRARKIGSCSFPIPAEARLDEYLPHPPHS